MATSDVVLFIIQHLESGVKMGKKTKAKYNEVLASLARFEGSRKATAEFQEDLEKCWSTFLAEKDEEDELRLVGDGENAQLERLSTPIVPAEPSSSTVPPGPSDRRGSYSLHAVVNSQWLTAQSDGVERDRGRTWSCARASGPATTCYTGLFWRSQQTQGPCGR